VWVTKEILLMPFENVLCLLMDFKFWLGAFMQFSSCIVYTFLEHCKISNWPVEIMPISSVHLMSIWIRLKTVIAQLAACICCFLLGLLFDPEDGGDMSLRNVGLSTSYNPEDHTLYSHHSENLKYKIPTYMYSEENISMHNLLSKLIPISLLWSTSVMWLFSSAEGILYYWCWISPQNCNIWDDQTKICNVHCV
jgi:hypothetical protein